MNKNFFSKKTLAVILENKTLRTACILILLLVIITVVLTIINSGYSRKIEYNYIQIQDSQKQLTELQHIIDQEEEPIDNQAENRSFAPYDQIIPFISLLESLFAIIDPESKITIKNQEREIFINRYADYEISLRPGEKIDLFLKGLDQLYSLKYLTKITDLAATYKPDEAGEKNEIDLINLTIRLYFE